ncbi:MAG TPA: prolyl oligopeptidase family serine peptidase [Candidatus Paceibacterota bacterium]|nr:prolyl oligopeptidase family serine peptidase [Verrucomicrobiota bacterium]HSA11812.1 prolyl oligopeptidase family serine peptidase [Candidatus Paceibacterota bacterium]
MSEPICRLTRRVTTTLLLVAWLPRLVLAESLPSVPAQPQPVTNFYQGVAVVDGYQWLEDAAAPAVREWTRLENERTRVYFARLPYRDGIAQQLAQLRGEESARYYDLQERKGRIFALRFKPPAQQPILVRLSSLDAPALWRTVFDPNAYNTNGTTAIDWYVPSPDGRLVAVCLSEGGSEQGALHFVEVDTGKMPGDEIPRVQYPTGGGSAAWTADSTGVFYTRYPHQGERPEADINFYQQVWFHRLGTPVTDDQYVIGKDFPRIAEIELAATADGRWVLATVANGDGGDYAHYLRDTSGTWQQLTRFEDGIKRVVFGRDGALYLLSRKNAPRGQVLRLPLERLELARATVAAPESRGVVEGFVPSDDGLYVASILGGPSELLYYPRGSSRARLIPVPPISTASGLDSWHGNDLVFGNVSYLRPFAWFTYDPAANKVSRTALYMTSPVAFDDIEVVREFATSKDGTKVPLNILRKKGLRRDGGNPTLLYGYGGYGISLTPGFDVTRRIWFDAGGVYVVANLRGGGEYGEQWHKAGNLTQKQHVFDDFIAAAEHLIKRRYTSTSKLAVEGASNGGLLMGAFLAQRPDLARAVVARVGIFDMLRVELDPNGAFNVTEFGTVKNPEQFKALFAYSPFHHVRDGVNYPAVLLSTGENDGRVNPAQSRKMAARLQAATASDLPILFRSTASAGHGIGSALKHKIAEQADILAFLFDQLGVDASRWSFQ